MQTEITADRLRELLRYDPETGLFTWAFARRGCRKGAIAGCKMAHGYIAIRLDDVLYTAHRLVWLYQTGNWPTHQIDHINGDRADNRFCNLREATNLKNSQNRRNRRDNKSGFTGVRAENKRWLAEIKVNYKPIRLGLFDTPEEAAKAYRTAKAKYHPFSDH